MSRPWRGVIAAYRDHLPVTAGTPVVTLHEGGTPLLPAPVLSDRTGCEVFRIMADVRREALSLVRDAEACVTESINQLDDALGPDEARPKTR